MADRTVDHLIVGGGPAGFSCAKRLRELGASGSIVLVTRDPDPPYDRTACSKSYLRGERPREEALLAPLSWFDEQHVELLTRTSAIALDAGEHTVRLSNKETLAYRQLLLATGANIRRLRVDGSDLDGLHYLRALGNADAIRRDVEEAAQVVLVGGSYIATEVAASLTMLGKRCSLVMQESVPLERTFGAQAGRYFQRVLEEHGIEVHGDDAIERFEGSDGHVRSVVTRTGLQLPADAVVIGAGVVPEVSLASRAGLEIGARGGVVTDASLRTSVPDVWAAGDIAEYESVVHGGQRLRIEHWDVAEQQGATVARAMLGKDAPHDVVPYFFSDLGDWVFLEYVGPAYGWDEEVVRGSLEGGEFTIWYLEGDRVVAALTVGRPDDLDLARDLIVSGSAADRERLASAA